MISHTVWYHTLYDIIQNFILTKKDDELKKFFSYRTKLCDYDSTTEIMAIYTKLLKVNYYWEMDDIYFII